VAPRGYLSFVGRAQAMLARAAERDPLALDLRPAGVAHTGVRVLRLLTAAAIGADPAAVPVDAALARAWRTGARGADVLRAALILCADHELNVSSFTARCVASSGSHPYAVVIAGLAALEGPRHGGAGARVSALLEAVRSVRPPGSALEARLRRGEPIDGFGHPLYRDGDPRAALLLDLLRERFAQTVEYRFVRDFAAAAADATREHPNIDFGLAAMARVLRLPPGAPLMLFAIGRSVGWIGHALEQYAAGGPIRPRARYVGPAPSPAVPDIY
jgi:citrate synthase